MRIVIEQIARVLPEDMHDRGGWIKLARYVLQDCLTFSEPQGFGAQTSASLKRSDGSHVLTTLFSRHCNHTLKLDQSSSGSTTSMRRREDLWRVQDIDAPPQESEAEKRWMGENKATPWEWVGEGSERVAV